MACIQGDRLVLGGHYFFRFNFPLAVEVQGLESRIGCRNFEYARKEFIQAQTERWVLGGDYIGFDRVQ